MKDIRFDQEFTIEGFWNLPNSSTHVYGIISLREGMPPNLHTVGCLNDNIGRDILKKDESYELIQGLSTENIPFTLLNCQRTDIKITGDSIPVINYHCQFVVQGISMNNRMQTIFSMANVEIEGLTDWCSPSQVDTLIEEHPSSLGSDFIRMDIRYKGKGISKVQINANTFIELGISVNESNSLKSDGIVYSMRYFTNFIIEKSDSTCLEELIHDIFLFKQFVSFGLGQDLSFLQINLRTKDFEPNSISLVCECGHVAKYNLAPNQVLFTYCGIKTYFPNIIKKWYENNESFGPIKDFLIESVLPSQTFSTSDFLKIAIALDSFYSQNIKNRIKLKPAIDDLVKRYEDIKILSNDNINSQAVAETRDTFVHFMKNKKEHLLSGNDLYEQTWYLRKLLVCCVMSYLLGIDDHAVLDDILEHSNCWLLRDYPYK